MKKIIHIDMDAFYASVEQRDFPEYRNKPLAVGGVSERGVLATASYEARKFGVKSAMPTKMAKLKCPELIVVMPRFEVYKQVSEDIRKIFKTYTDLVEPLSLDEAYLDVTVNHKNMNIATDIAKEIKGKIYKKTGLTASAGVSFNKFLAKIASDFNKPDGLFVITPQKAEKIIEELPIERFHGIGKVTANKMRMFGIETGADLKKQSLEWLSINFGKAGKYYYQVAHGEDNRQVEANQVRKSVGAENTFSTDLITFEEMKTEVEVLCEKVWQWVQGENIYGRTVTLKMRFADFTMLSRSKSALQTIKEYNRFREISLELLSQSYSDSLPVRLLGVTISNLDSGKINSGQLELHF